MSEAWRKVVRLGKKREKYPHILVESRGWCLRLGAWARADDKYYSSLSTLLQALSEHLLRRRDHERVRTVAEMEELLGLKLGDLDFDQAILTVQHGKGEKTRYIPMGLSIKDGG